MPLLLRPEKFDGWLPGTLGPEVLKPASQEALREWPVSASMNRTALETMIQESSGRYPVRIRLAKRKQTKEIAMKVTIEIDCTPEEARRFLGLPDVAPMQQAMMDNIQQRMASAIDATTPEALLRAWIPLAPEQMQQAITKLFGAFAPRQS
jgi:hypothetical protein